MKKTADFHIFCAAVWPIAFHSGDDGLPAAMRNLEEETATANNWMNFDATFLEAVHRDHPEWGIFEE